MRVDPPSGKMYWSDREGMRIQRSNLDSSNIETLVTTGLVLVGAYITRGQVWSPASHDEAVHSAFENGHADREFLSTHAVGAEELRRRAEPWTLDAAARTARVPARQI